MSTKEIKWTMFVITAVGNFIAMLDSTTVNLALYPMSVDLHVTMGQIQWVMIAYMLVLTVFLPFFGKLGDIFPKNKLYSIGFGIFALGAFLNTTAGSFGLLIAFRCLEALEHLLCFQTLKQLSQQFLKTKDEEKLSDLMVVWLQLEG